MYNECTLGHAVLFDASLLDETIDLFALFLMLILLGACRYLNPEHRVMKRPQCLFSVCRVFDDTRET